MIRFTTFTAVAAAVVVVFASPAQAEDTAPRTRAEVIQELDAARASGELAAMHSEDSGSIWLWRQMQSQAQAPTRGAAAAASATVRAASRSTGTQPAAGGDCSHAMLGEDSGSFCLAALPNTSTLTRAEVLAEVIRARARGELHAGLGEDSGSLGIAGRQGQPALRYAGPNVGPNVGVKEEVAAAPAASAG
jgi:hypothetical protein